jgi:superfamily II DNA helicase RecQ
VYAAALMENQVQSISSKGIPCDYLSSTRTEAERKSVLQSLQAGESKLKLLFVTPESCQTDG